VREDLIRRVIPSHVDGLLVLYTGNRFGLKLSAIPPAPLIRSAAALHPGMITSVCDPCLQGKRINKYARRLAARQAHSGKSKHFRKLEMSITAESIRNPGARAFSKRFGTVDIDRKP